jgi:L-2-hydroxyglutarate oxidase
MIVATSELELQRMEALFGRAVQNRIDVERLNAAELGEREPNIAGVGALFVRSTGIVDYKQVCAAMGRVIRAAGGVIECGATVDHIRETASEVVVSVGERRWSARRLVACGGLQSDRIARSAGLRIDHQIIPFRGEYFQLPASRNAIVHSLIYPVPDPELPFLGVHLTRMIDGSVTVGPNAVLGFAREGYPRFSFNLRDTLAYTFFPGFWRVIAHNRRSAVIEMRNSLFRPGYLEECRKYCPGLTMDDLLPYEAGIRAQAVKRDGTLVHDFLFMETVRMLHVCNAPSPAATSAIPIGRMIAEKCLRT